MKKILFWVFTGFSFITSAQSYTSYFTGNPVNSDSIPHGGICMMGGATEDDNAMKWFLKRANGGDILVLRTDNSSGYNSYMFNLGPKVNSVETIVCNNPTASYQTYVQQKIMNAEAIWFAGGDQWDYVTYWRNTPVDSLVNDAIQNRHIVVGGTSAGMAILGKFYYTAKNGSVTSAVALANPYNGEVTVDSLSFLKIKYLNDVITDTHYDNPDRRGRHVVFLARILTDYGVIGKGIACDEYTAVCIDTNGLARVYGQYPAYDDNAYFIQPNCELPNMAPETCLPGMNLNWNLGGKALKVYNVKGKTSGINTFDLTDWKTGQGGVWQNWYVAAGTLFDTIGSQIDCIPLIIDNSGISNTLLVYPNPCRERIKIEAENMKILEISMLNSNGDIIRSLKNVNSSSTSIDVKTLPLGLYLLRIQTDNGIISHKFILE